MSQSSSNLLEDHMQMMINNDVDVARDTLRDVSQEILNLCLMQAESVEMAQLLVEMKADVNKGSTLSNLIQNDHAHIVNYLIQFAEVDELNSALFQAVCKCSYSCADLLISNKATLHIPTDKYNMWLPDRFLQNLSNRRMLSALKIFLESNKHLTKNIMSHAVSLIHGCIYKGNFEALKLLIQAKQDVNQNEPLTGLTPLHTACMTPNETWKEMVLLLLENGADYTVRVNSYLPLEHLNDAELKDIVYTFGWPRLRLLFIGVTDQNSSLFNLPYDIMRLISWSFYALNYFQYTGNTYLMPNHLYTLFDHIDAFTYISDSE